MNDTTTKDVAYVTPLKKICMTIGELPSSYLETMSYYEMLVWFTEFLKNQVIPTVNNNAEAVQELQTLYEDLKTYVDNYFDNLDIQTEINKKIDELVEDGTIAQILDSYAQPILSDLTSEVNGLLGEAEEVLNDVEPEINKLRRNNYNYYSNLELDSNIGDFIKNNITIYESNDKQNYDYAINDLHVGTRTDENTIYVSPNVTHTYNTGSGTLADPYGNINKAIDSVTDGGTIVLLEGIYVRNCFSSTNQPDKSKSFNIIGEPGKENNVICGCIEPALTWTQDSTYTNVYYTTRSNVNEVIDIRGKDNNVFSRLKTRGSKELVSNELNTCYIEGTTLYVNIGEEPTFDKLLVTVSVALNIDLTPSANRTVYCENITFINTNSSFVKAEGSASYDLIFKADKCKFLFGIGTNALSVKGCNTILKNCEASYSFSYDGFNYHSSNNKICNSIEINCVGDYNGYGSSQNINNGSTSHDGSKILRINGKYYNNKGGNVVDINQNTLSLNFNCYSFDSNAANQDSNNCDYSTQSAGTTMYLYNCYSRGNSKYNLVAASDSTIYISNCRYDTTLVGQTGHIIDLNA